ncbi:MAG: hypothetical protein WCW32_02570 [Candidatus Paceibacterota bacterium]
MRRTPMAESMSLKQIRRRFGYDRVGNFSGGLAKAEKSGRQFHIKPDGTRAYAYWFDCVGPVVDGTACARIGEDCFEINPDGSRVNKSARAFV